MTSAWSITASAHPPRAVFLDFPLGHTAGRPNQPQEQIAIMQDTLDALWATEQPGTIRPLPYTWGESWKDAARAPVDHRTPRHDTPQYQTTRDREAAIAAHGAEVACAACAPASIPTG